MSFPMIKLPPTPFIQITGMGFDTRRETLIAFPDRRRTLFDLSPLAHCSVIGTCLTTMELRKIVKKILGDHAQHLSDHEIHTHGVRLASAEGLPTKLLNKALEEKHKSAVRRFSAAKIESDLQELWSGAKKNGQIEGAYWAMITHPATSEALFKQVFGDVHMLSHLVGSSNRADIRRLTQFEAEVNELRTHLEKTVADTRAGFSKRDLEIQRLQKALAQAYAEQKPDRQPDEETGTLRNLLMRLRQQLESEMARRERLSTEIAELKGAARDIRRELEIVRERNQQLESDLDALETFLKPLAEENEVVLCNKTILYVGGKSATIQNLRLIVERMGGSFLHHDGGQEQQLGLLPGLISRSDYVFFPTDFVSHQAMHAIKQYCSLSQKQYFALHRSGTASFTRALTEYLGNSKI